MKLLTPPGVSGVAVLEVEPEERAALLVDLGLVGAEVPPLVAGQPPRRRTLRFDGREVDDVLVVARTGGAVELHVHGSPAVLDQLDQRYGVRVPPVDGPAERLLRDALSPEQLDLALEQRGFDFDAELAALRAAPPATRAAGVAAALRRSAAATALSTPRRVALVGRQNAGKSTLFNALLFRERALTGATPGLTRDPVAEVTTLGGYPYELIDTAGEGDAPSAVDAAAISRGRESRMGALLVAVVDGAAGPLAQDAALYAGCDLVVRSKADLGDGAWPRDARWDLAVSAERDAPQDVRAALGGLLATARDLPAAGAVGGFAALDERQLRALQALDADGPPAPPRA